MKFRRKPYPVDALQWTGRNEDEMRCYLGHESSSRSPIAKDRPFSVYTPTGTKEVLVGDWVIKGFFNELEVVAPALFTALYEPVEEGNSRSVTHSDAPAADNILDNTVGLERSAPLPDGSPISNDEYLPKPNEIGGNKMSEKNGYKEACLTGGMLKAKTEEGGPNMDSRKYKRMKTKDLIRWCGYNWHDVLQFIQAPEGDLVNYSRALLDDDSLRISTQGGVAGSTNFVIVRVGDYIHRTENGALWVESGSLECEPDQGGPGTQEPMKDSESISDKTLDPFKMLLDSVRNSNDSLTASEALYGFAAWLTGRKEKVTLSSSDDAAVVADLVNAFIKANSLSEPRRSWTFIEPSTKEKEAPDAITALREYVKTMKVDDNEKTDTSESDVFHKPHWDMAHTYGKGPFEFTVETAEGILAGHYSKTIDHIIADKKAPEGTVKNPCPLDISLIPNTMGINLCSVKGVEWIRQGDRQLVAICIHFKPDNAQKSEEVDGKKAFVDVLQSATEMAKVDHEKAYAFLKFFVKTVEGEQTEGPLSREAFLGCLLKLTRLADEGKYEDSKALVLELAEALSPSPKE